MERAADTAAWAGAEDIPFITAPREVNAVGDGETVFDLSIVTTPGHTPGSISVYDAGNGILIAGDALRTEGGKPTNPSPQNSEDMDEALRSVAKIGALTFETLLVGHGAPIESGAGAAVAELAAGS
jgi:glyoxylase-like metal-dependent hydrolase (beta-lactamase superfamily II)